MSYLFPSASQRLCGKKYLLTVLCLLVPEAIQPGITARYSSYTPALHFQLDIAA